MSYELTNEEKIDIINTRKRNIYFNEYNLQINLVEESSKSVPNQTAISTLNTQISDIAKQLAALDAEIAKLTAAN